MTGKRFKVIDLKSLVRQIRTHLDRTAGIVFADLDEFLASGRFEENQLRAASTGHAAHLFETEHLFIKVNVLSKSVTR